MKEGCSKSKQNVQLAQLAVTLVSKEAQRRKASGLPGATLSDVASEAIISTLGGRGER